MSDYLKKLYTLGRPFSPLYGFAMSLRASLYRKGVFAQHSISAPVISVGNLTMGGTGKTPLTIYLANLLKQMRPAVVSRGYGGKAKGQVNIVSDGDSLLLDPKTAGDEPFYMAENLPGVPVLTSRKRVDGARYAVEHYGAGAVILDDAFQHLSLTRDVNLVLFKVDSFLGNNRLFPGGDMREPLKALHRADAFVLTCVDELNQDRAEAIKKALHTRFPRIPVFLVQYRAVALIDKQGAQLSLEKAPGPFMAFCGLANPKSFQLSLQEAGIKTTGFQVFRDHCPYMAQERELLKKKVAKCRAKALITTEKDLVKLKDWDIGLPLYALRMEVVPGDEFDHFVLDSLQGRD